MEFDLAKAIDIAINIFTIVVSALVIYNRMSNRLSLLEQKFDILTGNGFVKKEVVEEIQRRLDQRIDDLRTAVIKL